MLIDIIIVSKALSTDVREVPKMDVFGRKGGVVS